MELDISKGVCKYIKEQIRPKYRSNLEFAIATDIDESIIREILKGQKLYLETLQKICNSQNMQVSELLKKAGF